MDTALLGRATAGPLEGPPGSGPSREVHDLTIHWLGRVAYREAWALQHRLVAERAAGRIADQLLLLEHPPVITLGRQGDPSFVLAAPDELERRGIEVIRTERGGEVTYHGPGQLVAYPILRLADRHLMVRPLVRLLETAMRETCAAFGIDADRRDGFPGCWVGPTSAAPRKIGALGVRIEHGVTYHGIALNVTVDLAAFDLIDACGLPGVTVTSVARELGHDAAPSTESVREAAAVFGVAFGGLLGATADQPASAPSAVA